MSGSPRAVADLPCAEAPDRPGRAPRPTNRRLRIPFQYPQCQRARRSAGGLFKPTELHEKCWARTSGRTLAAQSRTRVICGAAPRCQTLSPGFLRILRLRPQCRTRRPGLPTSVRAMAVRPVRQAPFWGSGAVDRRPGAAEARPDRTWPGTAPSDSSLDNPAQVNQ